MVATTVEAGLDARQQGTEMGVLIGLNAILSRRLASLSTLPRGPVKSDGCSNCHSGELMSSSELSLIVFSRDRTLTVRSYNVSLSSS